MIRSSLKRIINKPGYELIPLVKGITRSDPYIILQLITWKNKVNSVIDVGAQSEILLKISVIFFQMH